MHVDEVLCHGGAAWITSHRGCIMRKVIDVTAGGRFDFFWTLD